MQIFTDHPASVGETYGEHATMAFGFAFKLWLAGCACLIHAVFPFLCVKTGSAIIRSLNERMVTHRQVN